MALNGNTLYAGGDFAFLDGNFHFSMGAVDATSGAIASWQPGTPQVDGYTTAPVYALAASENAVYVGGAFNAIGGTGPAYLALFNDNTPPTVVSITPSTTGPTNASPINFTVTFDESVQNFNDDADLNILSDGTSSDFVSISGGPSSYNVALFGVTGNGSITLAVNTSSDVQDLSGNALATSVTSDAVIIDTSGPSVIRFDALTTTPTNADIVEFEIEFNEDVQHTDTLTGYGGSGGFGGGVSGQVNFGTFEMIGGPKVYTLKVPILSGVESFNFYVNPYSGVQDLAGNSMDIFANAPTSPEITIDKTGPNTSQVQYDNLTYPTNAVSVDFLISFNEEVVGFDDASDVAITTEGTVQYTGVVISGGPPETYTATVQGISGDGLLTLATTTDSDMRDIAGNALQDTRSSSILIDNTGPSAVAITPSFSPTNGDVGFEVNFDEEPYNFDDASDLLISHTGTVAYTGVSLFGSGLNRYVQLLDVSGEGTITLAVATDSDVQDSAGNPLASSVIGTAVRDTTPYKLVSFVPVESPTNADTVQFIATFDEDIYGFGAPYVYAATPGPSFPSYSGVTATGGPRIWTVTVDGVSGDGPLTANQFTYYMADLASNRLVPDEFLASEAAIIDNTPPSVEAIVPASTGPTSASSMNFTVTFNEPVQSFDDAADVVVNHDGTTNSGVLISGGPAVYTVTVTGISGDGSFSLSVPSAAVTEGEGEGQSIIEGEGTAEGEGQTEGSAEGEGEAAAPTLVEDLAGNALSVGGTSEAVIHSGIAEGEDGIQTADQDGDLKISLSEILRAIQFYNAGALHCADNPGDTEDGYAVGTGENQICGFHDSDYNPPDWIIGLSELLRLIQLYNLGGYIYCPDGGSEDDFCRGT